VTAVGPKRLRDACENEWAFHNVRLNFVPHLKSAPRPRVTSLVMLFCLTTDPDMPKRLLR
jgi:hypothetical protein